MIDALSQHHEPKPSEIAEWFKFHSRVRKPGESVATYVTELEPSLNSVTLVTHLRSRYATGWSATLTMEPSRKDCVWSLTWPTRRTSRSRRSLRQLPRVCGSYEWSPRVTHWCNRPLILLWKRQVLHHQWVEWPVTAAAKKDTPWWSARWARILCVTNVARLVTFRRFAGHRVKKRHTTSPANEGLVKSSLRQWDK